MPLGGVRGSAPEKNQGPGQRSVEKIDKHVDSRKRKTQQIARFWPAADTVCD